MHTLRVLPFRESCHFPHWDNMALPHRSTTVTQGTLQLPTCEMVELVASTSSSLLDFAHQYAWGVPTQRAVDKLCQFVAAGSGGMLSVGSGLALWEALVQSRLPTHSVVCSDVYTVRFNLPVVAVQTGADENKLKDEFDHAVQAQDPQSAEAFCLQFLKHDQLTSLRTYMPVQVMTHDRALKQHRNLDTLFLGFPPPACHCGACYFVDIALEALLDFRGSQVAYVGFWGEACSTLEFFEHLLLDFEVVDAMQLPEVNEHVPAQCEHCGPDAPPEDTLPPPRSLDEIGIELFMLALETELKMVKNKMENLAAMVKDQRERVAATETAPMAEDIPDYVAPQQPTPSVAATQDTDRTCVPLPMLICFRRKRVPRE